MLRALLRESVIITATRHLKIEAEPSLISSALDSEIITTHSSSCILHGRPICALNVRSKKTSVLRARLVSQDSTTSKRAHTRMIACIARHPKQVSYRRRVACARRCRWRIVCPPRRASTREWMKRRMCTVLPAILCQFRIVKGGPLGDARMQLVTREGARMWTRASHRRRSASV